MAISTFELERAAAVGWRAPEETSLGDWLLRAAAGFTGRANSALAIGDPGVPHAAAIEHVRGWYDERGLPAMVAVPFPVGRPQASPVDRYLDERGWPVARGAIVMTADPATVAATADVADVADVAVDPEPDEGWLALYRYRGVKPPPISRQLLMSAPWQAFASIRENDVTVAIGRVAVAGDWAGLTAVEVDPAHRRRGLGVAITAALVTAATRRGVTGIYLQVDDGNGAARALYRQAGFTDHHGYHYRVGPAGSIT
jgi:ribosomal protein S18 acetylase RimI-like enzyme